MAMATAGAPYRHNKPRKESAFATFTGKWLFVSWSNQLFAHGSIYPISLKDLENRITQGSYCILVIAC